MELSGAAAVVTGGASGIGAAVARRLAAEGARVAVWDLKAEEAVPAGAAEAAFACDVRDPEAVERVLDATVGRLGLPTVLVACAGIGSFASVLDLERAEWERVLSVNAGGVLWSLRGLARRLVASGSGGSLVAVSSVSAAIPDRGMAAYCCSKAAVDMLVKVAAAELGPFGIRVNAVAPGIVETPLLAGAAAVPGFLDGVRARTALGAVGQPEQVAEAVVALVGADWVTGQTLVVDGGLSLSSPIDVWSLTSGGGPGRRGGADREPAGGADRGGDR
jgi:NAD(P)-dependent dehydrogenase (short-subunit alcohol dehydrogenase family)